jgi:hypothetical protein
LAFELVAPPPQADLPIKQAGERLWRLTTAWPIALLARDFAAAGQIAFCQQGHDHFVARPCQPEHHQST